MAIVTPPIDRQESDPQAGAAPPPADEGRGRADRTTGARDTSDYAIDRRGGAGDGTTRAKTAKKASVA